MVDHPPGLTPFGWREGALTQMIIAHDPVDPPEHPALNIVVQLTIDGLVELDQGRDCIVMPVDQAARLVIAMQSLPNFVDAMIAAMPREESVT